MSAIQQQDDANVRAIKMYGRTRQDLERAISVAGGGKAYAQATLQMLDGYLTISEHTPRGPDPECARRCINGVKYALSAHVISVPGSLLRPDGPIASMAAAADHLYFPDAGDGVRLPIRACVGLCGVDAARAAVRLLSDLQEQIQPVGGNSFARRQLDTARQLIDATLDLKGRPAPVGEIEYGETLLSVAADIMQADASQARAMFGDETNAGTLVIHMIRQARVILGCGMSSEAFAQQALREIREAAEHWQSPRSRHQRMVIRSMAFEYGAACRGDDPWMEPQISDGSGERFLPVVFVGESCWQLRALSGASERAEPVEPGGYEKAWITIANLRARLESGAMPEHLQWVQISGPGATTHAEPVVCSWQDVLRAAKPLAERAYAAVMG